jgi:hypothetical protein
MNSDGKSLKICANGRIDDAVDDPGQHAAKARHDEAVRGSSIRLTSRRLVFT